MLRPVSRIPRPGRRAIPRPGAQSNFNGEPEAAEVPKAGASLVSLGVGFGSKSAAMYQIKYAS